MAPEHQQLIAWRAYRAVQSGGEDPAQPIGGRAVLSLLAERSPHADVRALAARMLERVS